MSCSEINHDAPTGFVNIVGRLRLLKIASNRLFGGLNDGPRPGGPFTTPKQRPEIFRADEQEILHEIKNVSVDNDRLNPTLQYEWILKFKTEKQTRSLSLLIKDKQHLSIAFSGKGTKIEVKLAAHLLKVRELCKRVLRLK
ncbi:hypothetical protein Tco_0108743 [Tanacetum coccineum]